MQKTQYFQSSPQNLYVVLKAHFEHSLDSDENETM